MKMMREEEMMAKGEESVCSKVALVLTRISELVANTPP